MAALIDRAPRAIPLPASSCPMWASWKPRPQSADPIGDDAHSPVAGIVHRYRDRVLFKLTCLPVYCRFCFRREMVGPPANALSPDALDAALDYIAAHPEIREVILTGGDPFILSSRRMPR